MAVTHTHRVAPEGDTNHVDSAGHEFGAADHASAWKDKSSRAELEHTHAKVEVTVHPENGGEIWTLPKKKEEAETPEKPAHTAPAASK